MSSELTELHRTVITTPSDTEIQIERVFDAPRELVWDVYFDPELMPEWLGPREMEMVDQEMDFRPGGSYRYTHRSPDGSEFRFFGEFLEIERPNYAIQTFNFVMEPQPPPSIDRIDFEEIDGGRTRIVGLSRFESQDLRDGMLQAGMEKGVNEGYDRLDEILARRAPKSL